MRQCDNIFSIVALYHYRIVALNSFTHSAIQHSLIGQRAEDETRTRDIQLGRLMLYQLSYFRLISLSLRISLSLKNEFELKLRLKLKLYWVGVIGFEPIQSKTPDLQSGPALQLRRTPVIDE